MAAFDIGKLDDVIHGRVRLGIMAYLANAEVADFIAQRRAEYAPGIEALKGAN